MAGKMFARAFAAFLFLFAAASAWSPAIAANCSPSARAAADLALQLTPAQRAAAIAAQLPWGVPAETAPTSHESLLIQRDYVIRYDADLRVPIFTAERLVSSELGKVDRTDCFRADPRLSPPDASAPADYGEPLYDQGHIAAFANHSSSAVNGNNSFIMSNMAPQICPFNRGIWQILEGITRLWAADHSPIYVISGSVFDRDGDGVRDADGAAQRMHSNNGHERVAVPSAFYKIITYRQPGGRLATLSIMMPHDTSNPDGPAALAYLQAHVTTLAAIEHVTGLDFFPGAGDVGETATLWPFHGRQPRSLCHS